VQAGPQCRFYAGTPLKTERDINLGCLFVLDSQPRNGLSDIEKDALGTVASLVMDYLRVSRQAAEGRRATLLSRGLNHFVEGNSTFAKSFHRSSRSSTPDSHLSSLTPPYPRMSPSAHSQDSSVDLRPIRSRSCDARSSSTASDGRSDIGASIDLTMPLPDRSASNSRNGKRPDYLNSNQWTFQRAANLLRESLGLINNGGVIFLEASDNSLDDAADSHFYSAETNSRAPVLAASTNVQPFWGQEIPTVSCPAVDLDSGFLNQSIRRYPKGKLWSFRRDGTLSTSDEDKKPCHNTNTQPFDVSPNREKKSRASETSMLNAFFPNASQVIFVPLWNATNSQWYAGCFCWTTQETHVFSPSVDLSSVLGFASSIMTERSRIESLLSGREKGDFISSVSHELRSPLHGVLGAAEFLEDTKLNDFQKFLLETINGCGRTLLDTLNQVLDFSKIKTRGRARQRLKRNKGSSGDSKVIDNAQAHLDAYVLTDVAALAEEVIDGVCLGQCYMQRSIAPAGQSASSPSPAKGESETDSSTNVEVIVDIAKNDWVYKAQPGSLRRIIMNVLGNALKHTKKGRVSVCLKSTGRSEGCTRRQGLEDMVTMTISDTGRGISNEYLRRHLYTPFMQEDPLAVGTGLGLSIVRSIVKALNGSINVQSRPGEGTIVKVSLPLQRSVGEESHSLTPHAERLGQEESSALSQLHHMGFTGKRVAIWGVESSRLAEHPFWSSTARYITDWYGLQLASQSDQEPFDILIADEKDLTTEAMRQFPTALPSLLVFCNRSNDYSEPKTEWSRLAYSVGILRCPCGPHKLAKSILKCMKPVLASPTPRPLHPDQDIMVPDRLQGASSTPSVEQSMPVPGRLGLPPGEHLEIRSDLSSSSSDSTARSAPLPNSAGVKFHHAMSDDITVNTREPSATSSLSDQVPAVDASSEKQRKPRVLVVDDNSVNLNLMMKFMKKRNLTVLDAANNGKMAVDAVEGTLQGYDLIFMDLSMPVMDGFEATRAIRAIEKGRDACVPATVIAFTGLSSSRDESEALASGVDLFFMKPVSFKDVSRLIDHWEYNNLN
jgi:signal transduction histidine kinase/CheY-like chemotaxis protein